MCLAHLLSLSVQCANGAWARINFNRRDDAVGIYRDQPAIIQSAITGIFRDQLTDGWISFPPILPVPIRPDLHPTRDHRTHRYGHIPRSTTPRHSCSSWLRRETSDRRHLHDDPSGGHDVPNRSMSIFDTDPLLPDVHFLLSKGSRSLRLLSRITTRRIPRPRNWAPCQGKGQGPRHPARHRDDVLLRI